MEKESEDDTVRSYIEDSVVIHSFEKVSKPEARFKSYKIRVDFNEASKLLLGDFWPMGVGCRVYIPPRRTDDGSGS